MNEKRVLELRPQTFLVLVRQLRRLRADADIFEVDLDAMRVKGDLKVIRLHFPEKEFIARSTSLDLLKRAATAGWNALKMPEGLVVDNEFTTLVKNRGTKIITTA